MHSVGVVALLLSTDAAPVLAEGLAGDQGGGRHRDGKKIGGKFSRDNNLKRSAPALLGRFPDRRRRASMVSAMVAGVDRCRSRKVSFGRTARKPAPMLVSDRLTVKMTTT